LCVFICFAFGEDIVKGLLNGNQKNTLSAESVLEVIRSQAQERLGK
jgi:hypothetical protein